VLENGAPDTVRCASDTVRCASQAPFEPATLGKLEVRFAIIHRTARCATGLFGEPALQRLTGANGRLQKALYGEL
jgi:hypothetical protein